VILLALYFDAKDMVKALKSIMSEGLK